MTISIKHAFVSLKGDGGDATQVQPSYWNATHSTSMASGQLLGRLTAGVGAFEEIPISAYMASLLGTADAAALAGVLGLFETGDVKFTFKTTAAAGWLILAGGTFTANTIGSSASGALLRANSDTLPLYTIIWNACSNTDAPVLVAGNPAGGSTARGASAAADFAANKAIIIPSPVGKAMHGAGGSSSYGIATSGRNVGAVWGAESFNLAANQIPTITSVNATQAITVQSGNIRLPNTSTNCTAFGPSGSPIFYNDGGVSAPLTSSGNNSISTTYTNSSLQSVSLFQPSIALMPMVKL